MTGAIATRLSPPRPRPTPTPPAPPALPLDSCRFPRSSFFQSVCVLGYCVFPLLVSAVACLVLSLFIGVQVYVRVPIVVAGFVWATRGAWALAWPARAPSSDGL